MCFQGVQECKGGDKGDYWGWVMWQSVTLSLICVFMICLWWGIVSTVILNTFCQLYWMLRYDIPSCFMNKMLLLFASTADVVLDWHMNKPKIAKSRQFLGLTALVVLFGSPELVSKKFQHQLYGTYFVFYPMDLLQTSMWEQFTAVNYNTKKCLIKALLMTKTVSTGGTSLMPWQFICPRI